MIKNISFYLTVCCFIFSPALLAQNEKQAPVDPAELQMVVDSVSRLLLDNYVFPDKAEEMAGLLADKLKAGKYNNITEPNELAAKLTEDLRSVTKDLHLHVDFAPEQVTRIRERQKMPEEERPRDWIDEMRFNNYGFKEVKLLPGNVGYLDLRGFFPAEYAGETATAAMNFLSNCSALIIDLRQNGGGNPSMIQLITSYLYDQDEAVHLNNFYWRPDDKTTQTWTLPYVPGKKLDKAEVYVLTSGRTFSAAEEFTYNLKNLKRATIVGETTGGGAHPGGSRIATDRFMVWIPSGRAINPITNTNWEGTGVEPDVKIDQEKAPAKAHALALEKLAKNGDEAFRPQYEWHLTSLQAQLEPVQLTEKVLHSYAGKYGQRTLSFEDGVLYYQREGNPKYALTALAVDLFMFEEAEYFRLQVVKEGDKITGLRGIYDNGREDFSSREEGDKP